MLGDVSFYVYRTPYGPITIGVAGGAVRQLVLGERVLSGAKRPTETANLCATQLLEYFAGRRRAFDIPLAPQGSAFQRDVWRAIRAIPYGQTRTNMQVAEAAGHADAYRMVGSAVRKNPLPILIPAHRVVGAAGKPTGADRESRFRTAFLEMEKRHSGSR